MLTVKNATYATGSFTLSANLTVTEAKVTAVIGPSGAGKSTLLHGIAGFVNQEQGQLLWHGDDFSNKTPAQRPVSILFQDNNLFPHLSVLQNVALALMPSLRQNRDVNDKVKAMLYEVGLSDLSQRKPGQLSGGQQSRVALARALLQDRPILLLDEPFSALGPALKDEMLDLTLSLAASRTLIMVTHDPRDAERIADHVIGVADGVAFSPIPTKHFLADPPAPIKTYFNGP